MNDSDSLELRRTTDYASMVQLAVRSGLETSSLTNVLVAYGFFRGDTLVACAALKSKGATFYIECLAVEEALRGKGLGSRLVQRLELDARNMGAKELWALARRPAFFQAVGYSVMDPKSEGAPSIGECLQCRQYQVSCHPSVVAKRL